MGTGLTLVATGLSHKTASLSIREQVSLSAEELPDALDHMGAKIGNGVILSTCNRTEIYFVAEPGRSSHSHALDLFMGATGASHPRIEQHTYHYRDEAAVRHLHRVACGMDSMIFGEVEILRQVRSAMNSSFEAGFLTSVLDRLFHSALRAGRRLHAETFLGRHDRSVASAAVTLARGVLGDISESEVLVLGAGAAGAMTIRTMLREGASGIRVANRTYSRAASLAAHTGTVAIPLRRVPEALGEVDLVICASASPLVSKEALLAVMPTRCRAPIVLVDIGVPRNIDPTVRDIPGVHLFDMDDLMTLCPASPEERAGDMVHADSIFEEEMGRFFSWWRSSHAVPTITALEDAVEEARRRELAKTLRRMPSFNDEQREALEALTKALVKKVLHQPITRLKLHGDDKEYIALGRELFGLETNGHRPMNPTGGRGSRDQRRWPASQAPAK
jgi:glutamyl-tRNA reductase